MRVAGIYCGALKAPPFFGVALDVNFNAGLVDATGRHTYWRRYISIIGGFLVMFEFYLVKRFGLDNQCELPIKEESKNGD